MKDAENMSDLLSITRKADNSNKKHDLIKDNLTLPPQVTNGP
jgi:hypothetical protein